MAWFNLYSFVKRNAVFESHGVVWAILVRFSSWLFPIMYQVPGSRYKLYFLTQGYPATEAEAVQPHPISFLLEYWLYLHIIYFWKAKTQAYIFILINWFFNPIQPKGLVLEPKKALKLIFFTPNILYVFGKHFLCTFRFCH